MPGRVIIQTYAADPLRRACRGPPGRRRLRGRGAASASPARLSAGQRAGATARRGRGPRTRRVAWPRGGRRGRGVPGSRRSARCPPTCRAEPVAGGCRSSCGPRTRRAALRRSSACRRAWRSTWTPSRCSRAEPIGTMRRMVVREILTAEAPDPAREDKEGLLLRREPPSPARRHARDHARRTGHRPGRQPDRRSRSQVAVIELEDKVTSSSTRRS